MAVIHPPAASLISVDSITERLLIDSPLHMYSLAEFCVSSGFIAQATDPENIFWNLVSTNDSILVTEQILKWCGYSGKLIRIKGFFKRLLDANRIKYEEIAVGEQKTIIRMLPINLINAITQMCNPGGEVVRELAFQYKDLLVLYNHYSHRFKDNFIVHLSRCNEQALLDVTRAETRAQGMFELAAGCLDTLRDVTQAAQTVATNATIQPADPRLNSTYTMFLIKGPQAFDRRSPSRHEIIYNVYGIYTTRTQFYKIPSVNQRLTKKYRKAKVTQVESFNPEPNGINLYIRVKEYIRKNKIQVLIDRNLIHFGLGVTPDYFLRLVREIRDQRARQATIAQEQLVQQHNMYLAVNNQ